MMNWLSIDPGGHTGIARWSAYDVELLGAGTVPIMQVQQYIFSSRPQRVVIEWPRIFVGHATGVQTLIERAAATEGWALSVGAAVDRVFVSAWKGNLPKKITRTRADALLLPSERALCVGIGHDAWDAVALGLVSFGRARRGLA